MHYIAAECEPMTRLRLCRASLVDQKDIISLIEESAEWLRRAKNTDQWSQPWPGQAEHDHRLRADVDRGRSWILWDARTAAATITVDPDHDPRWPAEWCGNPAVYIRRFAVRRRYAGKGLGAELLDWASRRGWRDHRAASIRVNAWTDNKGLHEYYERQGFESCGLCEDDRYPSRARFQRPVALVTATHRGLFVEEPDTS